MNGRWVDGHEVDGSGCESHHGHGGGLDTLPHIRLRIPETIIMGEYCSIYSNLLYGRWHLLPLRCDGVGETFVGKTKRPSLRSPKQSSIQLNAIETIASIILTGGKGGDAHVFVESASPGNGRMHLVRKQPSRCPPRQRPPIPQLQHMLRTTLKPKCHLNNTLSKSASRINHSLL